MSTSIACSKLNVKSDTGVAFGVGRSSLCISSVHTSAAACAAFCNDTRKDVWILPVIVAVRQLRKVQWQIFLADLMERADHATQILVHHVAKMTEPSKRRSASCRLPSRSGRRAQKPLSWSRAENSIFREF